MESWATAGPLDVFGVKEQVLSVSHDHHMMQKNEKLSESYIQYNPFQSWLPFTKFQHFGAVWTTLKCTKQNTYIDLTLIKKNILKRHKNNYYKKKTE